MRRGLWNTRRYTLPPLFYLAALLAVVLTGALVGRESAAAWEKPGSKQERLAAPENALISPVQFSCAMYPPVSGEVTSLYGYRKHPVTNRLDFHTGMDIAAAEGTAIVSALPGTIAETGYSEIYGNYVLLRHGVNIQTRYCHCSEILVQTGERIREGDIIAKVGSTGISTGPHLHFEVYADGKLVDPAYALEVHQNA